MLNGKRTLAVSGAENHSALSDYPRGYGGERSARCALVPYPLVLVLHEQTLLRVRRVGCVGVNDGADLLAQSAINTCGGVNRRIAEALGVLYHLNATLRAGVVARPAAATFFLVVNINHYVFCYGKSPAEKTYRT